MLYLLKKDLKEIFENKKRIVILIIVLIIFIISTYYNIINQKEEQNNKIKFGVADEDGSVYSKMLLEYFKDSESFSSYITIIGGNSRELEQSFQRGNLDVYLQIPEGFAENMIYMKHLPFKVQISTQDVTRAILLRNILDSYEKYIRAVEVNCASLYDMMRKAGMEEDFINKKNIEISYDLIFTALSKEKFFRYQEKSDFPAANLFTYYYFGLFSILLNFSGLYAGFQIMKEKRAGILKRLYTAGTPVYAPVCEKILFTVGFLFVFFSLANLISNLYFGNRLSLLFEMAIFAASFFSVCFSVFLSGLFYRVRDFMIAGNFLNFLFGTIGGGIIPIMFLPKELLKLSALTPNYWLIRVLLSINKNTERYFAGRYIFFMLAAGIILLLLSVYLYKREEVYYEE